MRLALAALVLAGLAAGAAQAQDCTLKRIASLDMKSMADGRVLIPVLLDDAPHMMMPDTGAPIGILPASLARELGLNQIVIPPNYRFYVADGSAPSHYAALPSLKIGPDEARYAQFLIADWTNLPFDGTIGGDILKNFDVDIDFAANKFNLFSQDHCPGKAVYWTTSYTDADFELDRDSNISVTMMLDGHPVEAVIDTGAGHTYLNETDARKTFGLDTSSPGVEVLKYAGGTVYRYRFKSLSLAGISMPDPQIEIFPDAMARAANRQRNASKMQDYHNDAIIRNPTLILGMDALRHLHLYIAYKEKKIYATAADAH